MDRTHTQWCRDSAVLFAIAALTLCPLSWEIDPLLCTTKCHMNSSSDFSHTYIITQKLTLILRTRLEPGAWRAIQPILIVVYFECALSLYWAITCCIWFLDSMLQYLVLHYYSKVSSVNSTRMFRSAWGSRASSVTYRGCSLYCVDRGQSMLEGRLRQFERGQETGRTWSPRWLSPVVVVIQIAPANQRQIMAFFLFVQIHFQFHRICRYHVRLLLSLAISILIKNGLVHLFAPFYRCNQWSSLS